LFLEPTNRLNSIRAHTVARWEEAVWASRTVVRPTHLQDAVRDCNDRNTLD
jgi:hypothetical protein